MSETTRLRSGLLVFPNLTQLDLTGPYEVLARLPGAETLLLWKNLDLVRSEHGLTILPMATLASCAPFFGSALASRTGSGSAGAAAAAAGASEGAAEVGRA